MMKAIIFYADQVGALAMQAKLDASYGCPIAGVNVGGGIHAPAAQSATLHYGSVFQHPVKKTDYAVETNGFDSSKFSGADKIAVQAASNLAADWIGAKP